MTRAQIDRLVAAKSGILLDLSLGGTPQDNAVTLVELTDGHPLSVLTPQWPLPDGCVHTSVTTHLLEFLDPPLVFAWFDELHRVTRTGGIAYLSGPYGGDESVGWVSDPTHRVRIVEATFAWLDPRTPLYGLHHTCGRPQPKPWHVVACARVPGTLGTISYNATLRRAEVTP